MLKIMAAWHDDNGVRNERHLQMNDVIIVRRFEIAFAYSQAPGDPIEMTVCDALKNGAFDTQRDTMSVTATIKINGRPGTAWARAL